MATTPPVSAVDIRAAQEADRIRLQAALGQLHGVLHAAIAPTGDASDVAASRDWFLRESYAEIRAAYDELGPAFGHMHSELNSGKHDAALQRVGLAGVQAAPKFEHLRRAVARLTDGFAREAIQVGASMGRDHRWEPDPRDPRWRGRG